MLAMLWIAIVGGLLVMMGQQDRSEALFYYFRLEDQVPESHLLRLIERHIRALAAEVVAQFIKNYDPKRERAWVARKDWERVGAVFVAKESDAVAKLRLLHVEPEARGLGIATLVPATSPKGFRPLSGPEEPKSHGRAVPKAVPLSDHGFLPVGRTEVWVLTGRPPEAPEPPPGTSRLDKLDRKNLIKLWEEYVRTWTSRSDEELSFFVHHRHWPERACKTSDCQVSDYLKGKVQGGIDPATKTSAD
jgi:hypothetical protein